jgi:hypothetical protein
VTAAELAEMLAKEKARATTPTNQPAVLSPEVRKQLQRLEQGRVDLIQRRDSGYTNATDPFRGTPYGSAS